MFKYISSLIPKYSIIDTKSFNDSDEIHNRNNSNYSRTTPIPAALSVHNNNQHNSQQACLRPPSSYYGSAISSVINNDINSFKVPAPALQSAFISDHNISDKKKSSLLSPFSFLYRLASLWFISIAAGSVLCSIPISAIGLPFILGIGFVSMLIVFIMTLLFKMWISLLKASFRAVKTLFKGPFQIVSSLLRKITSSLTASNSAINQKPDHLPTGQPVLPINTRRYSTSSQRSFEPINHEQMNRWRYYDPSGNSEVLQSSFNSSFPSPRQVYSPSISDTSKRFDFDHSLPSNPRVLNAAFHDLNPSERDRLQMCAQLYSLTTSTPMNQVDVSLGRRAETGNTHFILSLWNEPNVNEPLELAHLIGFCEVRFVFQSNQSFSVLCNPFNAWYFSY
jgi:hypothetical protein